MVSTLKKRILPKIALNIGLNSYGAKIFETATRRNFEIFETATRKNLSLKRLLDGTATRRNSLYWKWKTEKFYKVKKSCSDAITASRSRLGARCEKWDFVVWTVGVTWYKFRNVFDVWFIFSCPWKSVSLGFPNEHLIGLAISTRSTRFSRVVISSRRIFSLSTSSEHKLWNARNIIYSSNFSRKFAKKNRTGGFYIEI